MAAQQSTPTLHFRGSPSLIEGLAPVRYESILAGTSIHLSVAGRGEKGSEALDVQTVPSGQTATLVRFSLPEDTPGGSYSGTLTAGDSEFSISIEVEQRQRLRITPNRLTLSGAPGSQITVNLTAQNSGNVTIEIPQAGGFGLFDVQGADRSIRQAMIADGPPSERRVDLLFDQLAQEHGGLVRVQFHEGAGQLPPGAFVSLQAVLRLPDGIRSGHTYSGTWPLANLRLAVRFTAPETEEAKEPQ
jgi:hypothetical protein